jgi:uncharacterized protein YjiS (DUF1127 family)
MIMSSISSELITAQIAAGHSYAGRLATVLSGWCAAYITWRLEKIVTTQLWSMSDRDLKDIGLTRSGIVPAVNGDLTRDRTLLRNCRKYHVH